MAKLIPIIAVPRSIMEQFLKSTQGMVQRRTWVKDTAGRSGHYRMQWVSPFDAGRGTADHSKQFDLFGETEPFEKPAPKAEAKRVTVRPTTYHGKEGFLVSDGQSKIVADSAEKAEKIKEVLKDGWDPEKIDNILKEKPAEAPLIDQIKVTKVTKRQIEFAYKGETYALGSRSDNAVALKTIQKDGKPWYSYGGKLGAGNASEVTYRQTVNLASDLRKKYGKYDPEAGRYDFSDPEKAKAAHDTGEMAKDNAGAYKVYHDSFTGVVGEVIGHLGKQGFYMAEDDVWNKISVGPGKPKDGRTDRYSMPLYDADGKPAGKAAHFQVYDMGNGRYELNLYTSPLRKTEYDEDKVKVRKEAGVTGEKPAEKAEGKADLTLTEQFVNMGASVAVADGMWVNYYDSGRMKVGTKKIGSAAEASKEAETFNREIESRTKHKREITNASGEAAMKRFSDAYSKKPDSYAVDYPNRKLGMQRARTRWEDESSPEAMAEIALANMKQGERFRMGRDYFTVTSITDKTLTFESEKGEKKSMRPGTDKWGQFIRDVGGSMLGWHHGSDAGDLVTAFRRDPAARYENGVLSVRDVGGAMKKSLLDTFREGLSKALGGR